MPLWTGWRSFPPAREPAGLPVVIISGHGTIQTAVEATRLGAFDFIEKPIDADRILLVIRNGLAQRKLAARTHAQGGGRAQDADHGRPPHMLAIMETLKKVAPTNARVLIIGENGTGKELVARRTARDESAGERGVHRGQLRGDPEELIESEFSDTKGCVHRSGLPGIGKFDLADGGTLFLDEVGDMSQSRRRRCSAFSRSRSSSASAH